MGSFDNFVRKGSEVENKFISIAESVGYECKKSTRNQDIYEHWDVNIKNTTTSLLVDVKGLKKIDRNDSAVNEDYVWLEIRNVKGEVGWLYAKESDGFVFETYNYFYYVDKKDVQKIKEEKVKEIYVDNPNDALYKLYKRRGNDKDELTMVKTIDLLPYAKIYFKK